MTRAVQLLALCGWFCLCGEVAGCRRTGAREFYAAPSGNDEAPGSRTQPWRTIAHAVSQMIGGDTLYLRGGVYAEHGIRMPLSGASAAPVTIAGAPGETAVIDGSLPQFQMVPNQAWEAADPYTDVYRSVAAFPRLGQVHGCFGPQEGGYALVPYEDFANLVASNEDYLGAAPCYVGPGVFWNTVDERIYIRLSPSRVQVRLAAQVPVSTDPGQVELFLVPDVPVFTLSGASWVVFDNLTMRHAASLLELEPGCRHLVVRNCKLHGGRYLILVRGDARDLTFTDLELSAGFPPWVARSDVKQPAGAAPAHLLQGSALQLEGEIDGVTVANCVFSELFDGIDTTGAATELAIHDNRFRTIRDDAFELHTAAYQVDFHHNVITVAAAGVSWNGSIAPPGAAKGTKYIHHNVIDTSTRQFYGRDDPQQLLPAAWRGPAGDGMATGRAFGSHDTGALNGPDPWKIYHNTLVGAEDVDGGGFGQSYRFPNFDPSVPHEVYNNIFVQTGNHHIVQNTRVADGSQIFDGNLYFCTYARPTQALLEDYDDRGVSADFPRLADFLSSAHWRSTHQAYAPGWEASGVDGDPGLDANYRPAANGPAGNGAVDLSTKDWPDNARLAFRGALPPH